MNPADFVYKSVLLGVQEKGVPFSVAKEQAHIAVDDYGKNKFKGRVSQMIEDHIKRAKSKARAMAKQKAKK